MSTKTGPSETAELVELLREQLQAYRALHRLAEGQRELIANEDPQALLNLLGERQKLVDRVRMLNRRIAPSQEKHNDSLDALSPADRQQLQALVREIGDVLKSILAADEQDRGILAARKAHTGNQIRAMSAGQQAFKAYESAARRQGIITTDQSA